MRAYLIVLLLPIIILAAGCVGQSVQDTQPKLRFSEVKFVYFNASSLEGAGLFEPCGRWLAVNKGNLATIKLTIENYGNTDIYLSNKAGRGSSDSVSPVICENATVDNNGFLNCQFRTSSAICAYNYLYRDVFTAPSESYATVTVPTNSSIEIYYVLDFLGGQSSQQEYCGKSYPIIFAGDIVNTAYPTTSGVTKSFIFDSRTVSITC